MNAKQWYQRRVAITAGDNYILISMEDSKFSSSTGKSKLESLTREDLIKFTKKQLILNQKSKALSEDLTSEIDKLKYLLKQSEEHSDDVKDSCTQSECLDLENSKEKLAEWEEMMKMLESERNHLKLDVLNLTNQETEALLCLDDIFLILSSFTKDKDLFFASDTFSELLMKDGDLLQKCRFLKAIIEEIIFERDEFREKFISLGEEHIAQFDDSKEANEGLSNMDFSDKIKYILEFSKNRMKNLEADILHLEKENKKILNEIEKFSSNNNLLSEENNEIKSANGILSEENLNLKEINKYLLVSIDNYQIIIKNLSAKLDKNEELLKLHLVNSEKQGEKKEFNFDIKEIQHFESNDDIKNAESSTGKFHTNFVNQFSNNNYEMTMDLKNNNNIDFLGLTLNKPPISQIVFADLVLEISFYNFIVKLLKLLHNLRDKDIKLFTFINELCILVQHLIIEIKKYFDPNSMPSASLNFFDLLKQCDTLIISFEQMFNNNFKEFSSCNIQFEDKYVNTCHEEKATLVEKNLMFKETIYEKDLLNFSDINSDDIAFKKNILAHRNETDLINSKTNELGDSLLSGSDKLVIKNLLRDNFSMTQEFDSQISLLQCELTSKEDIIVTLNEDKLNIESLYSNLSKEVEAFRMVETTLKNEKDTLKKMVNNLEEKFAKINSDHIFEVNQMNENLKNSSNELSMLKKDALQFQLIKLEISDFERTISRLNAVNLEHVVKIKALEEEIKRYQLEYENNLQLLDTQEKQMKQSDEQMAKLKHLLLKSKKELADYKKNELGNIANESQLKLQIEALSQNVELLKLELADVTCDKLRLHDQLKAYSTAHQFNFNATEEKLKSLEMQLTERELAIDSIKREYETYKVRVHNVLKQKNDKPTEANIFQLDNLNAQKYEEVIDQLKLKISDITIALSMQTKDNEMLLLEHETLKHKFTSSIQEYDINNKFQIEKFNEDKMLSMDENIKKRQIIDMLQKQLDLTDMKHKEELKMLQEDHRETYEVLKGELLQAQLDIDQLTLKLQQVGTHASIPEMNKNVTIISSAIDILKEERQSGEGSEEGELHKSVFTKTHSMSFEDLITPRTMLHSNKQDFSDLDVAQKQICHLRQLLNESESAVLRLTEQACILKEEIRRLERNEQRQNSVSNMEYLKNVIFKFLTLKSGLERSQLIPALHTMLKFSLEEKETLSQIASGGSSFTEDTSLWSAYISKWPKLL